MSVSKFVEKKRFSKKIDALKKEIVEQKRTKIKQLNQQLKRKNKALETKTGIVRDLQRKLWPPHL